MSGRGIASFLAGMGTGYFNAEEKRKEKDRQDKKDQKEAERFDLEKQRMQLEIDRDNKTAAKEDALNSGMQDASQMKIGQLRDQSGVVDTSEEGFKSRLEANGVDAAVAANAAPIYAQSAKQKGSESWLANSFGNPAAGGIGDAKPTSRGDIKRKQAEALTAGGKYDQAITLNDKAEALDTEDLQSKILAAKDFDEIDKLYDIVPDGYKVKSEVGKEDGRFRYWYEDKDGNATKPEAHLPQDFADFNEFKTFAAAYVKQNPEYITASWDKAHGRKREGVQDSRAELKSTQDTEKHDIDMKAGKIGLDAAKSDLKVKTATEGSRIESAGLEIKLKRANIANVYDEIAKRKVAAQKATTEAQIKANEEIRKNGDQYRQDYNAAVTVFDKSFRRDSMGNLMGDELDSKLYSEASKIIGHEIKRGASIDDAQAIARTVYDEAKNNEVSVDSAYKAIQSQIEKEKKSSKSVNTPSGHAGDRGTSAAQAFFTK